MATRCNIAVVLGKEDLRTHTFRKDLIPRTSPRHERLAGLVPQLKDIPYRPLDLSGAAEGQAIRIYCQFDGYVNGGVGETLEKHYNTKELALNLAVGGHLEHLAMYTKNDGTPGGGYENWAMSTRDKGQKTYIPQDRLQVIEETDHTVLDGAYLYLFRDDRWWVHWINLPYLAKAFPDAEELQGHPFWIPVSEFLEKDYKKTADTLLHGNNDSTAVKQPWNPSSRKRG